MLSYINFNVNRGFYGMLLLIVTCNPKKENVMYAEVVLAQTQRPKLALDICTFLRQLPLPLIQELKKSK